MFNRLRFVVMIVVCLVSMGCTVRQANEGAVVVTETPTPINETLPDLSIQHYRVVYDDCPWGGPGSVSVRVANEGAAVADPFQVQINNGTVEMAGIAADQTDEGVITFEAGPIGGINAAVDSTQLITERDETNNTYQILFTPPPPCPTETAEAPPETPEPPDEGS